MVWCQRRKWRGSRGWRNEEEFGSEEDDSDNKFVFNNLDEKSNPSRTIQFISDDQICEVVVQRSWDVIINIDVTCLHIATLAFCGDWDRRGRIIEYSTLNEGESKPHSKGGSRKCSVVTTKILPGEAINSNRFLVYKKPWLTYLCDVICWIATREVHRFEWNSSVVKAVLIVTDVHLNLSALFAVSRFLSRVLRCSWMKIKPGLQEPERTSLSPE